MYASDSPPVDYSLDLEVDGVLREADARTWGSFHLVGYSGGGAVALAVAARHPQRLLTLGLLEPAWAGDWDWSQEHRELWAAQHRLSALPPDQFLGAFMRLAVAPAVELPQPPAGDPPPWMALRPAGIKALIRTFDTYALDREALARFTRPVYFALGGLSNTHRYGHVADRLGRVFPDYHLEVSRTDTTSTRLTGPSQPPSPVRCARSGSGPGNPPGDRRRTGEQGPGTPVQPPPPWARATARTGASLLSLP